MITYAFTDGELDSIGFYSLMLNVAMAIGGSASVAFLWKVMDAVAAIDSVGRTSNALAAVVWFAVALVCVYLGTKAAKTRKSIVDRVKGYSKTVAEREVSRTL